MIQPSAPHFEIASRMIGCRRTVLTVARALPQGGWVAETRVIEVRAGGISREVIARDPWFHLPADPRVNSYALDKALASHDQAVATWGRPPVTEEVAS